jgi:hypothetical protein
MTCGVCGATIADKAIVCYRCGTPTAVPGSPAPDVGRQPQASRPRRSPLAAFVAVMLGVALLLTGLLAPVGDETSRDVLRLAGLALVLLGAVRLIVRRR